MQTTRSQPSAPHTDQFCSPPVCAAKPPPAGQCPAPPSPTHWIPSADSGTPQTSPRQSPPHSPPAFPVASFPFVLLCHVTPFSPELPQLPSPGNLCHISVVCY